MGTIQRSVRWSFVIVRWRAFLVSFAILILCGQSSSADDELARRNIKFTKSAFIESVVKGDMEVVRLFLDADADPDLRDKDGNPVLRLAAFEGHTGIIDLLLDKGADINLKNPKGYTALMGAVGEDSIAAVEKLIARGADMNVQMESDGGSALLWAVVGTEDAPNHKQIALKFIESGANVNVRSSDGYTPLMGAACMSDADIVRALLEHGADPNLKMDDGETALLQAARCALGSKPHNNREAVPEIIRLLMAHGADVNAESDGDTTLKLAKKNRAYDLIAVLMGPQYNSSMMVRAGYWFSRFDRLQGLVGPILYLLAVIISSIALKIKKPEPRPKLAEGDGLPRLKPLKCAQCAAPFPIAHGPDCPNCGSAVNIPEDYTETVALRAKAVEALKRAEKIWRRANFYSRPIVTIPLALIGLIWLVASIGGLFSAYTMVRPITLYISTILGGLTFSVAFMTAGLYLAAERKLIPPIPVTGQAVGDSEVTGCQTCGAAAQFDAGQLVTECGYCGTELFRAKIARHARQVASEEETGAATSLYDAMVALDDRRRFAFKAIASTGTFLLVTLALVSAAIVVIIILAALLLLYLYLMLS
ncbi:MAG: ankyrin repeat domain-containing protein [Blastocatellia bacterium]